jgi:membrane fusion protein (multidrug efflux system)
MMSSTGGASASSRPSRRRLRGLLRPGLSVEVSIDTRAADAPPALAGGVFGVAQAASK